MKLNPFLIVILTSIKLFCNPHYQNFKIFLEYFKLFNSNTLVTKGNSQLL